MSREAREGWTRGESDARRKNKDEEKEGKRQITGLILARRMRAYFSRRQDIPPLKVQPRFHVLHFDEAAINLLDPLHLLLS